MNLTDVSHEQQAKKLLTELYQAAVSRAQPSQVLKDFIPTPPKLGMGKTVVVGAGKAAGAMVQAFEREWLSRYPEHPMSGMVVTRYGHTPPHYATKHIEIVEAAHPVPDDAGLEAAERILDSIKGLTEDDLVVCLISGGGSALLTLPADGLTFPEKQRINQDLLMSGANIGEMNCVRKHLSSIKGGRLAAACAPARVVTLAISDVPGDDPSVIASGPTVADHTTCADALAILERYKITLPPMIHAALQADNLETPKALNGEVHLIATPQQSLEAAADAARAAGYKAYILSDEIEGESREVGKVHAALAISTAEGKTAFQKPCVILSGGETTVTVRTSTGSVRTDGAPKGRGGRAGEFCMGLAQQLAGRSGIYALAADTDGIDGIEDNAGAFVSPDTLQRATDKGLKLSDHLARNDSYGFFEPLGDLLVTGPTHTNVNDFRAIVIE